MIYIEAINYLEGLNVDGDDSICHWQCSRSKRTGADGAGWERPAAPS